MNLAVVNEAVTGMNGVEHEFTEEEKNTPSTTTIPPASMRCSTGWSGVKKNSSTRS